MLIIYTIVEDTLYLMRMGTHSQLFKWDRFF
jgi:mRNA-degrading endonuclease YafQ of YafQ-DinJ toxin-antitoxin module